MADVDKVLYLVNDKNRFWEVSVSGNESTIRYGKVGCRGRKFSAKSHESSTRCRQWAVMQANAKRLEGYEEPIEKDRSTLKRRLTSVHAERLGLSKQNTVILGNSCNSIAQPQGPIKQESLAAKRQQSIDKKHLGTSKDWRKPPKKQSTARALGKEISRQLKPQLTKRQESLAAKRQQSLNSKQIPIHREQWRKPHKKQSTVRVIGKVVSFQQKLPPSKRQESLAAQRQESVVKRPPRATSIKPEWRKPHKKQSTIRALARVKSIRQKSQFLKGQDTLTAKEQNISSTSLKIASISKREWRKPPKKQSTIRVLAKMKSIQQK